MFCVAIKRGRFKAAAALVLSAVLLPSPVASGAVKAVKATVPIPDENDITVTRVRLTSKSGSKLKAAPKIKVKQASKLPDGVSVLAGVAKGAKGKKKTDAYIVVVKPKGSLDLAPASLRPQQEEDVQTSITGRVPLKARTTTVENIVSQDPSSSSVCAGFSDVDAVFQQLVGELFGRSDAVNDVVERRCNKKSPFDVVVDFGSWTHHKPTQDETLVCALVVTVPAQADAKNHAFLGKDTGLGFPTVANGPGTLSSAGIQNVSFAVQEPGNYRLSVWVQGASGIAQSGSTLITVTPPPVNGPSECS